MKPGDLVFMQYDGDADHSFKAGDVGLIVARTVLPHPGNEEDNMFDVLIGGEIEYLFDYEMVLASDHLQLVNDGTDGYDREKEIK
jgi:hypothetical protein